MYRTGGDDVAGVQADTGRRAGASAARGLAAARRQPDSPERTVPATRGGNRLFPRPVMCATRRVGKRNRNVPGRYG